MIYQLAVLLLIFASVQGQQCKSYCGCGPLGPSVALAFDFGAGTALAANRQTFLQSLTENILSQQLFANNGAANNSVKFVDGSCAANLAATVGTPATGVIGCQTPPIDINTQYSCAFAIGLNNYQPFITCMNNLPVLSSGPSDIVSALARVRNGGTACNGLLNSCKGNVFLPCTDIAGTQAQRFSNLLIIFWSAPLSDTDKANAKTWLTKYVDGNYVNVIVVPILSTSLTSANKDDWTGITFQKSKISVLSPMYNTTANVTNTFDPTSLANTMTALATQITTMAVDQTECSNLQGAADTKLLCGDYCTDNAQLPDKTGVCTLAYVDQ